jgi:hypothetical protein
MLRILIASTLTLVIISGCANRPEGIVAQHVAHEKYTGLNCEELVTQLVDARHKLSEFSNKQDTKANIDAGGVFLALIPVSAFTGDYEGDVAQWKGEVQAIETAQIINKCKSI